jgi:hypothetical protein
VAGTNATTLDPTKVEAQAGVHETTRDEIGRDLDNLRSYVTGLLSASPSEATRALARVTEDWVDSVKKSVLEHMTAMVKNLRGAVTDQTDADDASSKLILDIPLVTNKFLGG